MPSLVELPAGVSYAKSRIVELAAEANAMHARVSSIFQIDGGWDARLVPSRHFQSDGARQVFGRGDTPEAALENAVDLLRKVDASLKIKVKMVFDTQPLQTGLKAVSDAIAEMLPPPAAELDDILG